MKNRAKFGQNFGYVADFSARRRSVADRAEKLVEYPKLRAKCFAVPTVIPRDGGDWKNILKSVDLQYGNPRNVLQVYIKLKSIMKRNSVSLLLKEFLLKLNVRRFKSNI